MKPDPAGRRRLHRGFAASTGVLLALVVAACGGEEEEGGFTEPASGALTKAEFLVEADRICLGAEAQIEAAADDLLAGRGRPSPAEVERVATQVVVPALEAEVEAIRALGAPPGDEARVEAILAATERGIALIERDPAAVRDEVPEPLREAQRLAERYGSEQCGLR